MSHIEDTEIEEYIKNTRHNFKSTLDKYEHDEYADFIIISTTIDSDSKTNCFNTALVGSVIKDGAESSYNLT